MNKYILVGKAASGKDWLLNRMIWLGYEPMKQYTTRAKRERESGDEYHFISEHDFRYRESMGQFVSVNDYRIGLYGVSADELIKSDVAILSPANVQDMFRKYPLVRNRFTIVYLDMPIELRRERLAVRYINNVGDDNEVRIANDERDFKNFKDYDIRLTSVEEVNDFVNNLSPHPDRDDRLLERIQNAAEMINNRKVEL